MERKYDIQWFETLDSTNNEALRQIVSIDGMSVISATAQTEGRGQRGNTWKTKPGENLTFSIAFRFGTPSVPSFPAIEQFRISEATALSLTEFLSLFGISATIKWPNDIYVGDKKICGILIETSVNSTGLQSCVIGIGLNVNQTEFPADLPNPVSMSLLKQKSYDIKDLLLKYIAVFDKYLNEALSDQEKTSLKTRYESLLYRRGLPFRYRNTLSGQTFTATLTGITPQGKLLLSTPGQTLEFAFKEIEFIRG